MLKRAFIPAVDAVKPTSHAVSKIVAPSKTEIEERLDLIDSVVERVAKTLTAPVTERQVMEAGARIAGDVKLSPAEGFLAVGRIFSRVNGDTTFNISTPKFGQTIKRARA